MPDPQPPADWVASLPEDAKAHITAKGYKTPADLAAAYMNAEKLIGVNRLPEPQKDWKPEQWDAHWNKLGRPESPDKYVLPEVQLPEGVELDPNLLKEAQATLHKAGLTDAQFKATMGHYLGLVAKGHTDALAAQKAVADAAEADLKKEWGDNYAAQIDTAKAVMRKFGDEKINAMFNDPALGNNPGLIRLMAKIGSSMLEDTAGGPKGAGLVLGGPAQAVAEIANLRSNKDFMDAYSDPKHVGHTAAVEKMKTLYKVAYPEA